MKDYDAIIRRTVFRNVDLRMRFGKDGVPKPAIKVIHRASSFTLDYESTSTPFYLLQLSGR